MWIKTSATVFFLLIVITSMFVANILEMIDTEVDSNLRYSVNEKEWMESNMQNGLGRIGSSIEKLIWFVQISDIHVSLFHDAARITDLRDFCDLTVPAINPAVVLASGDLTDAKLKGALGSVQYEEEWKKYWSTLNNCKSLKHTKWLDIRGNHDNFDVPGSRSDKNLFRHYAMQGLEHHSYGWVHYGKDGTSYGFIALDACPDPGLRWPFNFMGLLTDKEVAHIRTIPARKANYTIWFGHYPTSCILSKGSQVRKIVGEEGSSVAYLCGHLHTLAGMVPEMYTFQKPGFLELELGDWKDNRMFRVGAIDHGLFSFVDVKHKDWPVVLVTNPKHILFWNPIRESKLLLTKSTHIRVLAFSTADILSVEVKLDDGQWEVCQHVEGPLYVLSWLPELYTTGLHTLQVMVIDKAGREKIITQPFSLDGTKVSFSLLPRLILMSNATIIFQVVFGFTMVSCILPLCIMRYINSKGILLGLNQKRGRMQFFWNWIRKIWIVSNMDRFFYPLALYPVYISVGPWSFGELIQGHYGVLFAWGAFINGTFLPGGFTYAYGFFQLFLFQGPLILVIGHTLDSRLKFESRRATRKGPLQYLSAFSSHFLFLLLLFLQTRFAYAFWLSYGTVALLCSPLELWPLTYALWAWRHSHSIHTSKIRKAAKLWLPKEHIENDYLQQEIPN